MRKAIQLAGVVLSLSMSAMTLAEEANTPVKDTKTLPLEELRRFSEVFDRIKHAYVEPVDDAKVLEDAIRGMIAGLDPHSTYLEPKAFEALQEYTSGEFGGVGIEITLEDDFIRVITPIDDTPATKAGIKAGDIITRIDGDSVKRMSLDQSISKMRGKVGSQVVLTVLREGENKPLEITVIRDVIQVTSVKQRMLNEDYGYVRITQFQAKTGEDLEKSLTKLQASHALKGLVIDLRNNPGGVLQAAVEVVDALISEGKIVYTQGRIKTADVTFNATAGTLVPAAMPIVVLINGGSASASEIVAGALQDHQRAIIMGTGSFGKGSVQTILPLTDKRALKLTTARYFTPNGRSIQADGIQPDVVVENAELKRVAGRERIKERDLSGHLANGDEEAKAAEKAAITAAAKSLAVRDYQLYEALSLLKALTIARQ